MGTWVHRQRSRKKFLDAPKILKLEQFNDWVWTGFGIQLVDIKWESGYEHLLVFFNEFGHSQVKQNFVSPDGFPLGHWVSTQRARQSNGKLSIDRIDKLNKLSFVWSVFVRNIEKNSPLDV